MGGPLGGRPVLLLKLLHVASLIPPLTLAGRRRGTAVAGWLSNWSSARYSSC